jgi:hypothetical protein
MSEEYKGTQVEEFGLTSELSLPNETTTRKLSLKRLAQLTTALTLGVGAVLTFALEENIDHYDPDLVTVSASMLPKSLPNQVKAMEKNVSTADVAIDSDRTQSSGSGIQLNDNTLITAGHVFRDGKGNMFPGATWCNAFIAISPRGFFRATAESSVFSDKSSLDFALLRTKPLVEKGGSLHTVNFADKSYVGEPLYFINYQETPKGYLRPPDTSSTPAIYGGVVEGYDQNGDINVPTVVSYGIGGDYDARLGSSGGPVFNAEGELVGISVQVYNPTSTVKEYSSLLRHVGLEKFAGNMQYTTAVVEPVTPKMVNEFEASLVPLKPC